MWRFGKRRWPNELALLVIWQSEVSKDYVCREGGRRGQMAKRGSAESDCSPLNPACLSILLRTLRFPVSVSCGQSPFQLLPHYFLGIWVSDNKDLMPTPL